MKPGKPLLFGVLEKKPVFFTWQSCINICMLSDFYFCFFNKIINLKCIVSNKQAKASKHSITLVKEKVIYSGFLY